MGLPPPPHVPGSEAPPTNRAGDACAICGGRLTDHGLAGFRTVDPTTGQERLLPARVLACARCGTLRLTTG